MAENANQYLTVLLSDNENIKNLLTAYLNTILVTKSLYPKSDKETEDQFKTRLQAQMKPEEKQVILTVINNFRAFATRIKISINNFKDTIPTKTFTEILEDYKSIKTDPMPEYDTCERYVQNINDSLADILNVKGTFGK